MLAVLVVVLAIQASPFIGTAKTNFPSLLARFTKKENNAFKSSSDVVEGLEKLKSSYPFVDQVHWNMIRNMGIRHIDQVANGNARSPFSFHVVGNDASTLDCFTKKLAKSFTSRFSFIDAKADFNFERHSIKYKYEMDEALTRVLKRNKTVIVKNFQVLHFKTAQLFMTYCDEYNTDATFPDSIVILTSVLQFDDSLNRKEVEKNTALAYKKLWAEFPEESVSALWSRIGDGLVVVKSTNKNQCR